MQAQCQLVVYTEHKLCCLASNTSAKMFFFSHSEYPQINIIKHVSTPVNNLI